MQASAHIAHRGLILVLLHCHRASNRLHSIGLGSQSLSWTCDSLSDALDITLFAYLLLCFSHSFNFTRKFMPFPTSRCNNSESSVSCLLKKRAKGMDLMKHNFCTLLLTLLTEPCRTSTHGLKASWNWFWFNFEGPTQSHLFFLLSVSLT